MITMKPVAFRWQDNKMVPTNKFFMARAEEQFNPNAVYVLTEEQARSPESHGHFFAALHEAWLNLSEEHAEQHPTSSHLRAWALVKCGFADKTVIVCATPEDAIRTAAIASTREKIRIIEISGRVITVWIPKSQSMKAMGKEEFERSKREVLDLVAAMARTTRSDLEANAGKAC